MSNCKQIKIACIGAGYFARFHIDAWSRIPEVDLVAICDIDHEKATALAKEYQIGSVYSSVSALIESEQIDVIDIITPPESHLSLCSQFATLGIHIICQKPLTPTYSESKEIVDLALAQNVHFVVHENFRFQPWHRKIKSLIDQQEIGDKLHSLYFQMRMGDGWTEDAYLSRQPYFRTMPRLLIYETGVHYIDVFRFMAGEVESVYAQLRKLNPDIAGEDCGVLFFNFESGAKGVYDANRFNESNTENARYTFGEMLVEGNGGSIRLSNDGKITVQKLGQEKEEISYEHKDLNFAGDCVYHFQKHFINCFINQIPFENTGQDYLQNLKVQEAVYKSSLENRLVEIVE